MKIENRKSGPIDPESRDIYLLYKARHTMHSVRLAADAHADFAVAFSQWKDKSLSNAEFLPFLRKHIPVMGKFDN